MITLVTHDDHLLQDAWKSLCSRMALTEQDAHSLTQELLELLESGSEQQSRGYTKLPSAFHATVERCFRDRCSTAQTRLLDLLLVELARQFEARFAQADLPESLLPYYAENITRILLRATRPDDWAPSARSDIFLKDMGILRMTLIPCASHLIFRHSGVPRSLIMQQSPAHLARALVFFGIRTRGFAPFLENHVHPEMLTHFNPKGRERCYQLVGELLQRWPESRGLMGLSWYYDPAVPIISPRLAYLCDVPKRARALFLPAGSGPDVVGGATSTSETRRKLFEAGKYLPTRYLMAWARNDLLTHIS